MPCRQKDPDEGHPPTDWCRAPPTRGRGPESEVDPVFVDFGFLCLRTTFSRRFLPLLCLTFQCLGFLVPGRAGCVVASRSRPGRDLGVSTTASGTKSLTDTSDLTRTSDSGCRNVSLCPHVCHLCRTLVTFALLVGTHRPVTRSRWGDTHTVETHTVGSVVGSAPLDGGP